MLAIDETITAALDASTIVAFSMSGGKDSSAAAIATNRYLDTIGHPRANRIAIHADLGAIEWPQTTHMVKSTAALLELPIVLVHRSQGGLIERWQDRFERALKRYADLETYQLIGPWSSPSLRFCTSELKTAPITRKLTSLFPGKTILSVIGIRREESPSRSKTPISNSAPATKTGTRIVNWHPIVDWSKEEVFACHHQHNVPLHPAYVEYGLTRLSCAYCIMSSRHDIERSAASRCNETSLHAIVALELRSAFPFQLSHWLADLTSGTHGFSNSAISTAKDRRAERIAAENALPADLKYVKGWPPRIPSLSEAAQIRDTRAVILADHNLPVNYPTTHDIRARFAELHEQRAFAHAY